MRIASTLVSLIALLSVFVCLVLASNGFRDNTKEQVVDDTTQSVLTVEGLRQIAVKNLSVGMERDDVYRILKENGLSPIVTCNSGVRVTYFYGAGNLGEPVMVVSLRRDPHFNAHITEWYVEK